MQARIVRRVVDDVLSAEQPLEQLLSTKLEVLRNVCEDCGKRSDTERTMLRDCQVMLTAFLSREPQMAPCLASGGISQFVKCVS